jgi:hypothetical protein
VQDCVGKTAAQAAIAIIGTGAVMSNVNWVACVSAAVLAGILSLLTSLAGLSELPVFSQLKKPKSRVYSLAKGAAGQGIGRKILSRNTRKRGFWDEFPRNRSIVLPICHLRKRDFRVRK